MLPLVFILGVIEVIVLNRPIVETVLPSVGPLIVSVLSKPSVSVPTIVKVLSLSLAVDVIDTLVPKDETKAGIVPTSISPESPSTFTSVTVLKTLVPVLTALLPFTPVITSVITLSSWSVPVIVYLKGVLSSLSRFLIVILEFRDVLSLSAPSRVITPAPVGFMSSTIPLLSAAVEFNPFIVRAVAAVPDWAVAIELVIFSDVPLNRAFILFSSGPSTNNSPDVIFSLKIWPSKFKSTDCPSFGREFRTTPLSCDVGVSDLKLDKIAVEISFSVSALRAFASIVVFQFPSAALVPILILPSLVPELFIDVTVLNIFVVVTTPPFDPNIVSLMTLLSKSVPLITKLVPVLSCLLFICICAPR